jgi:NADPH:quinone reductase-like Zn-dependent oxidoreductase
MPTTNQAAWLNGPGGQLTVAPAPDPEPGPDQILVRNHALAVNPVDWIIQVAGRLAYRWLTYPAVLGSDVAGEVVQVGRDVTRFRPGDRVLGHAVGTDKDSNRPAEGAFQRCTVLLERLACPIPDTLAYQQAVVLPMGVSTAASGLFQADQLGLSYPAAHPAPAGQAVLIWGGSTSVGSNAIQLAAAAGYQVITTCSPANFGYVKDLGAEQAFDYRSPEIVPDVVRTLAGRTLAGALAIGVTSAPACVRIAARSRGRRFVSIATPPVSFAELPEARHRRLATLRTVRTLITANVALQFRARSHGVGLRYIWGSSLKNNQVAAAIYRDFLPAALADGRYAAAPPPTIVGHSLEDLQHALDLQRKGVSAAKVVLTLTSPPHT